MGICGRMCSGADCRTRDGDGEGAIIGIESALRSLFNDSPRQALHRS